MEFTQKDETSPCAFPDINIDTFLKHLINLVCILLFASSHGLGHNTLYVICGHSYILKDSRMHNVLPRIGGVGASII